MARVLGGVFESMAGQGPAAELPAGVVVHKALVFSEPDEALRMDLFLPRATGRPVPCILVIVGGGFMAQDGQRFRPFAVFLAERGFAAALPGYRGRPNHTWRETLADVKAAVRYVRSVSGQYGLDPEKLGAMGRSAGATLAVLLAVTGGNPAFEGTGGHAEFSSAIQAAVGYAGVYDFVTRFTDEREKAMQRDPTNKIKANGEWVGAPFSATDPDWLAASALSHVDGATAPMLLMHCKDDPVVPWPQSRRMYEKLKQCGVDAELKLFDTGMHGFRFEDPKVYLDPMSDFFEEILGK